MTTFITRLEAAGDGPRLAVKDLIDVAGVPRTCGCRAIAREAVPAAADAPCVATARAAGARIVGTTNLHELAFGATGINPWFGTPVNPIDAALVPGGSSSGSAVAVANEEADVAYGTDTGGSVRVPSACCATAGLKTTHLRVPIGGVWPLSASLDTVGPMARDVAGLVTGMRWLEPGFEPAAARPTTVGRARLSGGVDPAIDEAVDRALRQAGLEVLDIELRRWDDARTAAVTILFTEALAVDGPLVERHPDGVGDDVAAKLKFSGALTPDHLQQARATQDAFREELAAAFDRVELIALPTMPCFPSRLEAPDEVDLTLFTLPVNLAGIPALALPVPTTGPGQLPASLQLLGPSNGEEQLLAAGAVIEAAAAG